MKTEVIAELALPPSVLPVDKAEQDAFHESVLLVKKAKAGDIAALTELESLGIGTDNVKSLKVKEVHLKRVVKV